MTKKIIDFDALFFEYARKWMVNHPGLSEQQVEDSYNLMMAEWMRQKDERLDGAAPENYFDIYDTPESMLDIMRGYSDAGVTIPEPLYTKIVNHGEGCVDLLIAILQDENEKEPLRAEVLGMLRDIGTKAADACLIDLVCGAEECNELSDMAADVLRGRDPECKLHLMDRYETLSEYSALLVLDICSDTYADPRVFDRLIDRLRKDPEHRALCASYIGRLGDDRAVETLKQIMRLTDLTYFDYIELRNAVEELGGEVEEERTFYGDPDYEALRNLE